MTPTRNRRCSNPGSLPARRGYAMFAVVVTLAIFVVLAGGLVIAARDRYEHVLARERQAQAAWLADSGLARAAARLRQAADYAGEKWDLAAERLGGADSGLVTIRVEPVPEMPARRRVLVTAEFPAGAERAVRRSREAIVELQEP